MGCPGSWRSSRFLSFADGIASCPLSQPPDFQTPVQIGFNYCCLDCFYITDRIVNFKGVSKRRKRKRKSSND